MSCGCTPFVATLDCTGFQSYDTEWIDINVFLNPGSAYTRAADKITVVHVGGDPGQTGGTSRLTITSADAKHAELEQPLILTVPFSLGAALNGEDNAQINLRFQVGVSFPAAEDIYASFRWYWQNFAPSPGMYLQTTKNGDLTGSVVEDPTSFNGVGTMVFSIAPGGCTVDVAGLHIVLPGINLGAYPGTAFRFEISLGTSDFVDDRTMTAGLLDIQGTSILPSWCVGCLPSDGAVIDDFERTQSGLGTSSSGPVWAIDYTDGTWSVNGSAAVAAVGAGQECYAELTINAYDFVMTAQLVSGSGSTDDIACGTYGAAGSFVTCRLRRDGVAYLVTDGAGESSTTLSFGAATQFKMRVQRVGTRARCKIWQAVDNEPIDWTLTNAVPSLDQDTLWLDVWSRDDTVYTANISEIAHPECANPNAAEPMANQPIQDELVGTGDGSTVIFYTAWPYNPQSLELEIDGEGVEVDPTDWRIGKLTALDGAPGVGARVVASYLRAEYLP